LQVIALLPESEGTLGAISRLLTLDQLSTHLGESTAKMVLDLSHGIDEEQVKSTIGALPKSITSFKSFPATSEISTLDKWLNLLASDIINRVDLDCRRNNRYPKTCTVHIHSTDDREFIRG
jgi:nucleotidyltransferase/DNA polymerase involved in DNA repair